MAGGASYTLLPLKRILESKHKLIQVYTKYPKPSGRGNKISANSLQEFLEEKKSTVFLSLKTLDLRRK